MRLQTRGRALVAATAVVLGLGVAALVASQKGSGTGLPDSSRVAGRAALADDVGLPPVAFETGVVHVHGLGVDPADGVLYAATHSGLFRIPTTGRAVRVANRDQDTMGFSVTGPSTFIGSGHPDFREDDVRPPLLGLLLSEDAGQSWERLSLHGVADFHALQAVHGLIYGYDSTSQTFMVSSDRRTWKRRARLLMGTFVVSPTSADVVLATSQAGLVRSNDGGRTYQPENSDPKVLVLAWPSAGSLYAVDADGTVRHSRDGGQSWERRGTVGGEPEALTVAVAGGRETVFVAVSGRGIVASVDRGATFSTRYRE